MACGFVQCAAVARSAACGPYGLRSSSGSFGDVRCDPPRLIARRRLGRALRCRRAALHVLDAKLPGPPRQELVELRLRGPDNLVLEHLYQPFD
jgi:hypothetical protein